jgi:hypothetical protein
MVYQLVGSNVVVAAHSFNPSVFSQTWLARTGILREEDLSPGFLFSDQVMNAESREFGLLVVPPQLQFTPKVTPDRQAALVSEKVGAIVETLPHTPYTAIGLNFFWHIEPEDGNVPALTRRLFFVAEKPICEFFNTDDSRFGAYFSKDVLGCRLKLDVKPIMRETAQGKTECLQFGFNFHLDIPQGNGGAIRVIRDHIARWGEARDQASEIVGSAVA